MPFYPIEDEGRKHEYFVKTYHEKSVADYLGIPLLEVDKLNYIDFLFYRREAFIMKLSQTDSGQEYLEDCWRLEQTTPDREGLRKKFGTTQIRGDK